jgi:catechol 2,3-dioxygenase-like lactoylglutathione lyase family enzyme
MALHRLLGMTMGVPDPETLDGFYREIGFVGGARRWGPEGDPDQIRIEHAAYRQLTELRVACHSEQDLAEIEARLDALGVGHARQDGGLEVVDPVNKWRVVVEPRSVEDVAPAPARPMNRPGERSRQDARPGIWTESDVRPPRRLGHVVIGTNDVIATHDLYVKGLGFRISDVVGGLGFFTRCSPDHHNLLITPGPVPYLNHYAIERDDMDAVMKAATEYLAAHEGVQIAGPGRHMIGGNVFWYLKDPSGTFFEQFADMDWIADDAAWEPGEWGLEDSWSIWGEKNQPEVFFQPADIQDVIDGFNRDHG